MLRYLSIILVFFFVHSLKAQDPAFSPPEIIGINSDRPGFSLNPQNPGDGNAYIFGGIATGGSNLYRYDYESNRVAGILGMRYGLTGNLEIGGFYFGNRQDLQFKGLDTAFYKYEDLWQLNARYRVINNDNRVISLILSYDNDGASNLAGGILYTESISKAFAITSNFIYRGPLESGTENESNLLLSLNLQFPLFDDFGFFIEGVGDTDGQYYTDIGIWFQSNNHLLWDIAYTQGFNNNAQQWIVDLGLTYSFTK